ncbi:MAG: hypothetical protein ACOC7J_04705 [Armatimonadota bacterium]
MSRLTRSEVGLALLLVFALTLAVGLRGRLMDEQVNWDGLAAVAHAYDVFNAQPNANLAMIGFVQPPLPVLLQLPVVLVVPALATSGIAANLLGALCAGASAALLLALAADFGLSRGWRWPLTAVFALHPFVLGPAACGAPLALLTALLLGASWAILRWERTESLRDLIAMSLLLSGALITRYEAVFIVVGVMIYLGWRTWQREGSWDRLEGTMITFALPIAYVAGIWVIANWAIMGDPWHFARETFDLTQAAGAEGMATLLLGLALVAFFPVLALVYHQMKGTGRHPAAARPVAWVVVAAMIAPVVFPSLFAGLGEDGPWADLLTPLGMILAGGFAMLAVVVGDLIHGRRQHGPMAGTFLIVVGSLLVAGWLWTSDGALPVSPEQAYLGRGPLADSAADEIEAARMLCEMVLPEDRRHLVAGWPGFAVALFGGRTGEVTVIRTPELSEYVDELWVGSTLVLLTEEETGGFAPTLVAVGRGLPPELVLVEQWRAGPWTCFRAERGDG